MRRILTVLFAVLSSGLLLAQTHTGGVKGTVVNREDRQPVEKAKLTLMKGTVEVATAVTGEDGSFLIPDLPDGMYSLLIEAPDFLETQVEVTVNDGYVKNMFNLGVTGVQRVEQLEDAATAEFDMEDSGYNDSPTVLFNANDIFSNIAGYGFSSVRFKQRGFNSETQEVYFAGVKMNDALTGYGPFSLWSGLNEAMRSKDTSVGLEAADYNIGGYNGTTNVDGTASAVRKGLRGSVLTNSALYRLRLMASYATGRMDNGWAFAANVSARLGGNDWIDGVYYRSFAYYLAADKYFGDRHRLSAVFFATPGQRGAQNASTQEVYNLMGDNMYNSNWGYQNGKVRNTRVRKTHEPVALLRYEFTPSDKFNLSAAILYRFGKNGYTALDWYDAQDPRPDYYRNLPSYFFDINPDLKRNNMVKYAWATEAWTHSADYPNYTHVDWDRLYNANYNQADGRSKYIQEERHVDQRDFNFVMDGKLRVAEWLTLLGGGQIKINRTEYYKKVADLMGGEYFIDIDNFAERDFAADQYKLQNDLDYFIHHGEARKLGVGDKYGYDYLAQVRSISIWGDMKMNWGNFSASIGGRIGYTAFWREGLMRKGLFPGTLEDTKAMNVRLVNKEEGWPGNIAPVYDSFGNEVTSYGKSDVLGKPTGAIKVNANYVIGGNMRVYGNFGYFRDAPSFAQGFISPRTRNTITPNLRSIKTLAGDINWQFSGNGYNVRLTGYWARQKDISKVMSAYDDIQNAFSNFVLTGIQERHYGLELGFKVPLVLKNLYLQGALALGRAEYSSNPVMIQTIDNSSELVSYNGKTQIDVPYWASSPVFKRDAEGNYLRNENGEYDLFAVDHYKRHYVPSTPQLASSLGLSYSINYWFFELAAQYFDGAYLDMNPLYRTDYATSGPDNTVRPEEIEYMTSQEKFDGAFLLNMSVGKSWYIQRKYQLGFSLNAQNLLNNRSVKTGGYEQTRIVDNTANVERFYKFDSKYFYMSGINYMLNVYFRF